MHLKASAIKDCGPRKADKVTRPILVSKELLEFLSDLERVQFITSISVAITLTEEELQRCAADTGGNVLRK